MARYDFRRPNKLGRDQSRALQMAAEAFARQWTTVLSMSLRAISGVTVGKIEQRTYDEHVQSLPNPAYLAILSLPPLTGTSVLHLPLRVVMATIDRLVGGPGGVRQPGRAVTEIEAQMLRTHLNRVLPELRAGFEVLVRVEPELTGHESNPQFAQVAAPNDMVVVIEFELRVGPVEGLASLCIPFTALEPVFAERVADARSGPVDPDGLRLSLSQRLDQVPIDVGVRFAPVVLTAREVAALQPGDVVDLHHRTDEPLDVTVAGEPRFPARLGRRGSRRAVQVVGEP